MFPDQARKFNPPMPGRNWQMNTSADSPSHLRSSARLLQVSSISQTRINRLLSCQKDDKDPRLLLLLLDNRH
jgi:hypothetical protein